MAETDYLPGRWPGLTEDEKGDLLGLSGLWEQLEIQTTVVEESTLAVAALKNQIDIAREAVNRLRTDLSTRKRGLAIAVSANEQIPEFKRGILAYSLYASEEYENPLAYASQLEHELLPLHEALKAGRVVLRLELPMYDHDSSSYVAHAGKVKTPGLQLGVDRWGGTHFEIDAPGSQTARVRHAEGVTRDYQSRREPWDFPRTGDSKDNTIDPRHDSGFMDSTNAVSDFLTDMSFEHEKTEGRRIFSTEEAMIIGERPIKSLMNGLANFSHPAADLLLQSIYLVLRASNIDIGIGNEAKHKIEQWRDELAATTAAELLNSTYMGFDDQSGRRQQTDQFSSGSVLSEHDYRRLAKTLHALTINNETIAKKVAEVSEKASDSFRLRQALVFRMAETLFSDDEGLEA